MNKEVTSHDEVVQVPGAEITVLEAEVKQKFIQAEANGEVVVKDAAVTVSLRNTSLIGAVAVVKYDEEIASSVCGTPIVQPTANDKSVVVTTVVAVPRTLMRAFGFPSKEAFSRWRTGARPPSLGDRNQKATLNENSGGQRAGDTVPGGINGPTIMSGIPKIAPD